MREPLIHSHVADELPEGHPLAHETVYCTQCGEMLHAFNNECMQTWVETGAGNFCIGCFAAGPSREGVLGDPYGLPEPPQ